MTINGGDLVKMGLIGHQTNAGETDNVYTARISGSTSDVITSGALVAAVLEWLHRLIYAVRDRTPGAVFYDSVKISTAKPSQGTPYHWVELGEYAVNEHGNDTSDTLPAGVSPVVTATTATSKRRGRKFLAPFGEIYSGLQTWTASALSALALYALEWLVGAAITGPNRLVPIVIKALQTAFSDCTGAVASTVPGYQRRRKPGVGA